GIRRRALRRARRGRSHPRPRARSPARRCGPPPGLTLHGRSGRSTRPVHSTRRRRLCRPWPQSRSLRRDKEIMATHPVRLFGDPVLKQRSREVEDLNGSLVGLAESMYETMYEALGLGLAAPQIGVQRRIFTYDVGEGPQVIIIPELVEASGERVYNEGCWSVPGMHFEIVLPKVVTLRGVGLDGNDVVIEADEVL